MPGAMVDGVVEEAGVEDSEDGAVVTAATEEALAAGAVVTVVTAATDGENRRLADDAQLNTDNFRLQNLNSNRLSFAKSNVPSKSQ
ncbi:hypothetical protein WR25_09847 [Diploscapter pachys]|uniref:Uncharacterized protein n=1 Tax=Diploscapter pachys TaxID=2018661 RepID=A0A2A2JIL5_9BILA|nr:hypothetical protein WR25_09847 [Diploscapter pachys]